MMTNTLLLCVTEETMARARARLAMRRLLKEAAAMRRHQRPQEEAEDAENRDNPLH